MTSPIRCTEAYLHFLVSSPFRFISSNQAAVIATRFIRSAPFLSRDLSSRTPCHVTRWMEGEVGSNPVGHLSNVCYIQPRDILAEIQHPSSYANDFAHALFVSNHGACHSHPPTFSVSYLVLS